MIRIVLNQPGNSADILLRVLIKLDFSKLYRMILELVSVLNQHHLQDTISDSRMGAMSEKLFFYYDPESDT